MSIEEINLLVDACDGYISLGQGGRVRLKQIIDGDSLDNHPDILLKSISEWLQQTVVFLGEPGVAVELIDEIEMYLFGTYLEEQDGRY